MQYLRLYTDAQGESHFADVDVELQSVDYAPPAPPLHLSAYQPARQYSFMVAPAGWEGDWHPSPHRQMLVVLKGELEMEVSDGEVRRLRPGDVSIGEDTSGKGHRSLVIGEADCVLAIVHLA